MPVLRDVWANYRDESFILQFLSPRLTRHFGLFHVTDDAKSRICGSRRSTTSAAIAIKQALARHYDPACFDAGHPGGGRQSRRRPAADPASSGDEPVLLEEKDARMVLQHIADLWGYDVVMTEVDPADRGGAEGARRLATWWNCAGGDALTAS